MPIKLSSLLCSSGSIRNMLLRGSVGNLTLKILNSILGLATSIILARVLGLESFGVYAYITALASFLALPATAGVPALIMRETAKFTGRNEWGSVHGIWKWGTKVVLVFSLLILTLAGTVGAIVQGSYERSDMSAFFISLLLIPLFSLSGVRSGALRGLKRVVLGEMPDLLVRPLLFLAFLMLLIALDSGVELTPFYAIALQLLALMCSFIIGVAILVRILPTELHKKTVPVYEPAIWWRSLGPLALISSMAPLLQYTDILMVGFFNPAEDVGLYRVALSASLLVAFGLQSINAAIGPHLADLYHNGSMDKFRQMVTLSTRVILMFALPVFVLMVVWGRDLIVFLYGKEYVASYVPLVILIFGQLVNAAMGAVGQILNMTGHERDTARTLLISVGINVLLNSLFIPIWGISGAASATAITIVVRNILLRRLVMQRLGVETLAFSFVKR